MNRQTYPRNGQPTRTAREGAAANERNRCVESDPHSFSSKGKDGGCRKPANDTNDLLPRRDSYIETVALQACYDALKPLPEARQKALTAALVEIFGTPESPNERERAVIAATKRRRRKVKRW